MMRVAIDIAEACELLDLQETLVGVALDPAESHATRVNAAYAVRRVADEQTKVRLKPLVWETYESDADLELKGVAMSALWKAHLTTEELFSAYQNPPPNLLGSYKSFIYGLTEKFDTGDFAVGLAWLRQRCSGEEPFSYETETLATEIVNGAWRHLEDSVVFNQFMDTLLPFARVHRSNFSGMVTQEIDQQDPLFTARRRRVLLTLLRSLNDAEQWRELLFIPTFQFYPQTDTGWLIDTWLATDDSIIRERVGLILLGWIETTQSFFLTGAEPSFLEEIAQGVGSSEDFAKLVEPLFLAVDLESNAAKDAKQRYADHKEKFDKLLRPEGPQPILDPPPREWILSNLERFENGETDYWWVLNRNLTIEPNSNIYGDEYESDLEKLPGWIEADKQTRERIINGAKRYLLDGEPHNESWLGTNIWQYAAWGGYRALRLLIKKDPAYVDALPAEVWAKWTPIIYFYPLYSRSNDGDSTPHLSLAKTAYQINPSIIRDLVSIDVKKAVELDNCHISFEKWEYCWDKELVATWRDEALDDRLPEQIRIQIFERLFELEDSESIALLGTSIKDSISIDESKLNFLFGACRLLIQFGIKEAWPSIWILLNENAERGKSLLENGVFRFGKLLFENLEEREVSELYLWLVEHYPHASDPDHSQDTMAHSVGPREQIGSWRDSALYHLKERGTEESVRVIEEIVGKLPHIESLKFTLIEAKDKWHEKAWQPHTLPELRSVLGLSCVEPELAIVQVVYFTANADSSCILSLDEELRSIKTSLRASEYRDAFHIDLRPAARASDIQQALNEVNPDIVHFSGHGTNTHEILLQDDDGHPYLVSKNAMVSAISSSGKNIRAVLLNLCYSDEQAKSLVAKHVDVAIGMCGPISDKGAEIFAARFYSALGFGCSVKNAYDQAISELRLQAPSEEHTPQLYARSGIKADELTFVP